LQVLQIGLVVQPGVGSHPDPLQDVLIASERFEAVAHALEHRRKQVVLLALPKGFAVHHDLMLGIDHRHAVVALNHPFRCLHLGALGIGDVALHRLAAHPNTILPRLELTRAP